MENRFSIAGFSFTDIEADKRVEILPKQINIRSTPSITSLSKLKDNRIKVSFTFIIEYLPGVATMKFDGFLLVDFSSKKMVNEVIELWNEKRKLEENLDIFIKNFLFRKCLTLGIFLAERMNLPPPLMFPQVVKKGLFTKKSKVNLDYIG